MKQVDENVKNSKASLEIEGLNVPDDDIIKIVINKYKDKLGDKVVDSLLYAINMGTELMVEENEKNANRRSFRK